MPFLILIDCDKDCKFLINMRVFAYNECIFFARLTFSFLMQLLPINSFKFPFFLKVVICSSWNNLWKV